MRNSYKICVEVDDARSKYDLERAVKLWEPCLVMVGTPLSGDRRADLVLDYLGLQYQIACNMQICKIEDNIAVQN